MFDTPEEAGTAVGELVDAVWILSALAAALGPDFAQPRSTDDPAGRLLASFGLWHRSDAGLEPTPAVVGALAGRAAAFGDGIRSTLGQAATSALSEPTESSWAAFGPQILKAQGRASSMWGVGLAMFVIPALEGLAERFGAAGGVLLDVGVGVAELACAFCEAVPGARVVGIDPLPQALELAAGTVEGHHLEDRVVLRAGGIERLDDDQSFDLAWVPVPFLPWAAVCEGLPRVHAALKPGGWLLLAGSTYEPGLKGEIARWQTHLAGGSVPDADERDRLVMEAGFVTPTVVSTPPGVPQLFAARRSA